MKTFTVILHKRLQQEFADFRKRKPEHVRALDKTLEKLRADPYRVGGLLKGMTQPELQGRVYKLYVGGNDKYRLLYFVHPPAAGKAGVPGVWRGVVVS